MRPGFLVALVTKAIDLTRCAGFGERRNPGPRSVRSSGTIVADLKRAPLAALLDQIPHDPTFGIVDIDSFRLPVCHAARVPGAYRCRSDRAEAAFGKDTLVRQTVYGLHVHVRLEWPGVTVHFCVVPANTRELTALAALTERRVYIAARVGRIVAAMSTAGYRLGHEVSQGRGSPHRAQP